MERELTGLDELERRGRASGVPGLRRLAGDEIGKIEPAARGLAGLHSPQTGIADFGRIAESYAADVAAGGGTVHLGATATGVAQHPGTIELRHSRGTTRAAAAIFCAGLWADRLAVACGAPADPRIVPFRGGYLEGGAHGADTARRPHQDGPRRHPRPGAGP